MITVRGVGVRKDGSSLRFVPLEMTFTLKGAGFGISQQSHLSRPPPMYRPAAGSKDFMLTDPTITPPPIDTPSTPEVSPVDTPQVQFSAARWFFSGLVRLLYRFWTRIAANLFPEDSRTEQIALTLHVPLPDRLNMSWITDHLAVGGRIRTVDIGALARVGVTHVVDTRLEHCDDVQALAREHIKLLYLPAPDTQPLTVEQMMEGARWTHEHIKQGAHVLIHCEHGVGRSVLLACAVLVYGGMSAHDALQLVQEKRWQAAPNHRQVVRLQEFEATLSATPSA